MYYSMFISNEYYKELSNSSFLYKIVGWPKLGPCCSLTFEGIDNVHGCYSLPLGVLSIGNGITDDILKEYLQDMADFFMDKAGDTSHNISTCQTTDTKLGNTFRAPSPRTFILVIYEKWWKFRVFSPFYSFRGSSRKRLLTVRCLIGWRSWDVGGVWNCVWVYKERSNSRRISVWSDHYPIRCTSYHPSCSPA